uniref:Si:ch211-103n10.5 n=1 Tax=Oryzias melastigma TaxID=30732 RepID=A0A3B3CU42_ORYME
MSSAAIALPAAPPAKSPKKKAKKASGPTLSSLILKAVSGSSARGGVSLAALKKALKAGGYDVVKNKGRIGVAIKRLVKKKTLVRAKGSFKLNKKKTLNWMLLHFLLLFLSVFKRLKYRLEIKSF